MAAQRHKWTMPLASRVRPLRTNTPKLTVFATDGVIRGRKV